MATTTGVRTWKRLSSDTALPLEQRVQETTHPADMKTASSRRDLRLIVRLMLGGRSEHRWENRRYDASAR